MSVESHLISTDDCPPEFSFLKTANTQQRFEIQLASHKSGLVFVLRPKLMSRKATLLFH